jgi:hypothetical protein
VIQQLRDKGCGASLRLVRVSAGIVTLSIDYSDPWALKGLTLVKLNRLSVDVGGSREMVRFLRS